MAVRRKDFKSKFEYENAVDLEARGVPVHYETLRIEWVDRPHKYTPDFVLPNGIIIETKGRFTPQDRAKHLAIKKQHPLLDIRFVFQRAKTPINKGSKTSVSMWAGKHNYKWAEGTIPQEWIDEE